MTDMTLKIPIHIDSDLAPLERAMQELQALADTDPDTVRPFFEELEANGDVARQLFRINDEDSGAERTGYVRVVFEPSERLSEFLAACGARDGLEHVVDV